MWATNLQFGNSVGVSPNSSRFAVKKQTKKSIFLSFFHFVVSCTAFFLQFIFLIFMSRIITGRVCSDKVTKRYLNKPHYAAVRRFHVFVSNKQTLLFLRVLVVCWVLPQSTLHVKHWWALTVLFTVACCIKRHVYNVWYWLCEQCTPVYPITIRMLYFLVLFQRIPR